MKKTASQIRREVYELLKENGEFTYSELREKVNVPNTNFAGAMQTISKHYPQIVKVKRGKYKFEGNLEDVFRMNVLNTVNDLIDQVDLKRINSSDYKVLEKLMKLKDFVELELDLKKDGINDDE